LYNTREIVDLRLDQAEAGTSGMAQAAEFSSEPMSSRFCHLCGRRLSGRFIRYDTGLTVCMSCEASRPRCARCRLPLADGAIAASRSVGGPQLCGDCARVAPQCAACHQPILGVFYTFEELLPTSEVRRFCARCVQHRPRCDLCHAPVAEGSAPLADGQWRCALCGADLALGDNVVRAVYTQASSLFARIVGGELRTTPRLVVVGRREMGEVRRRYDRPAHATPAHATPARGAHGANGAHGTNGSQGTQPESRSEASSSHHVLGYFVRNGNASTIYVERALPRIVLLGTLAHELGHAWQAENAPTVRDPLLCEGFAEWVAHRVLVAAGQQASAARATRRDDLYGRGLRHFLGLERAQGRAAVLAAAAPQGAAT
jgi:hypothetical protein